MAHRDDLPFGGMAVDGNRRTIPLMAHRKVHRIALSDGNAVRSGADFLNETSAVTVIAVDGPAYVRLGGATVEATATPGNGTSPDGPDIYVPMDVQSEGVLVLPGQTRISAIRHSGGAATEILVYER